MNSRQQSIIAAVFVHVLPFVMNLQVFVHVARPKPRWNPAQPGPFVAGDYWASGAHHQDVLALLVLVQKLTEVTAVPVRVRVLYRYCTLFSRAGPASRRRAALWSFRT